MQRRLDILRGVALVAVVLSAVGSFGLMLHVGEYRSNLLMLFFAVWDLSPFAALAVAGVASKRLPKITRAALYGVMLCIAGESVMVYGRVVWKKPAQPTFAFLVVPLASWTLLIIVVLVAHVISTKKSGDQPLFRA
jgi:hypothetical protein